MYSRTHTHNRRFVDIVMLHANNAKISDVLQQKNETFHGIRVQCWLACLGIMNLIQSPLETTTTTKTEKLLSPLLNLNVFKQYIEYCFHSPCTRLFVATSALLVFDFWRILLLFSKLLMCFTLVNFLRLQSAKSPTIGNSNHCFIDSE